jgi:N-acetylglucosamine-6-phosphate deacetylase
MKNANDSTANLLLRNARLVLPDRINDQASLLIEDGRIARIFDSTSDPQAAHAQTAIDLDGLTLYPGFIDIHIHGAAGVDTMEANADDLQSVAVFLAQHGVTSWLPTLVPAPENDYEKAVRSIEQLMRGQDTELRRAAARVLGLHYEGPFINNAQCGALRPAYFRTFETNASLDGLATLNENGALHMTTIAPEIAGGLELIVELRRRGWLVSIGHTRALPSVLDGAHEAGARHMTHFMNAMPPLHHRDVGPIGWGLLRDDVSCDIIADGVHLDVLMLKLLLRSKTPARLSLISDAIAPTGLGDGQYEIWGETITVSKGRTQNARGNIAGSVITMLDAVRMMLSLDVSPMKIARMAAANPAQLLRLSHECGTIEEGKRADLTALDKEGNVRLTLIGGRVAHDERSSQK